MEEEPDDEELAEKKKALLDKYVNLTIIKK